MPTVLENSQKVAETINFESKHLFTNTVCTQAGVEIRFCHLGTSQAKIIGNLGALIRIWGPTIDSDKGP